MKKRQVLFILIIIIASLLRFYNLGINPPSLSWDEAALGYNAYSISQTLRDEHGKFLPIDYYASFGDYKPPVYVYTAVLPAKFFGLNEFSTRFPSAFFGVLTVILTYFLTKEIAKKFSSTSLSYLPLLSTLFLAISPWHIQMSRAAFEANIASFFIVLAVWLFLKGRSIPMFLIGSIISFVLSAYTFNSARIVSPLLFLGLIFFFRKEVFKYKKILLTGILIGAILTAPLIPHLISKEGSLRFQEVNIFSDAKPVTTSNLRQEVDKNIWWSKIIHNRRILYVREYLRHYLDTFDTNFLFIDGDGNPKFSIRDIGELYWFDLLFLLSGLYFLIKRRTKELIFILFWWLVAPIPAAMARETPHALRLESSLPTWQIIFAFGFLNIYERIQKSWRKFFLFFSFLFLLFNVIYYVHNYHSHYPSEFSGEWQYGYKDVVNYVSKVEKNYDRVVMTEQLGRPYIYFLYYKQYPPEKFWEYKSFVEKDNYGFISVRGFDKYEFRGTDWVKEINKETTLYIMSPSDVPQGVNIIKTFKLLNGNTILQAFVTNL